ncbi:hypothetical protein C4544_01655 [candidate division WS5 bacterium]|uniref:Type 4 fimbrial biogenesis protein PilX N-terminal domain-containing protein n=1 Tax=candidate division WS5 bacterium TaxID=2093353 RepID=A0A419DFM2_9BACT|nr:MAG: hypothetical protein C4544_01655 [candidate division WS5 bacterium]
MLTRLFKNEDGSTLAMFVIVLSALTTILLAVASASLYNKVSIERAYNNAMAMSIAEAGVEKAIWEFKQGLSYTGEVGNTNIPGGEFDVQVTDIDTTNKYITAIAYVPSKTDPKYKKAVKVKLTAQPSNTDISFSYAVQSGVNGMEIGGSSNIEGSLYSNGNIRVYGSAEVHDPGNAWAVGTIDDGGRIKGTKTPGAPAVPLPNINLDAWRDLAASGGTISGGAIPTGNFGPKKINGSATFNGGNLNIMGPIYITGSLSISGSGNWNLDDSLGSGGTVVIVDGSVSISGGHHFNENEDGGYIAIIAAGPGSQISYTGSATGEKVALFAPDGTISLAGSGRIVAMMAKGLSIMGSGKIEYEQGTPVISFPGAPGGAWQVKEWQEISPP